MRSRRARPALAPVPIDNFSSVEIRRLKDSSSPSATQFGDRIRRFLFRLRRNVTVGAGAIIKRGVRLNICETASLSLGEHCVVHEGVRFILTMPGPKVTIGKWVHIGFETVIAAKQEISIGDFTMIAPRCYFIDLEHGFGADQVILNQQSSFAPIRIGRDCYFGTGAVITKGVTIGDGAMIAANAVVCDDIGPYEIWGGVPARFIKKRT